MTPRHLVLVLGDQLDGRSAAFDGFDAGKDAILHDGAAGGSQLRPMQHKRRLAYFFAAMRHFAREQRAAERQVHYVELDDPANRGSFPAEIRRWIETLRPQRTIVLEPGDWRVRRQLEELPIQIREDRHFLCSHATFAAFTGSHRQPVLETFYRFMRRRRVCRTDRSAGPAGGA